MNITEIKRKVRTYLSPNLSGYQVKDYDDLFDAGFVNSIQATKLIAYLEKEFSIRIPATDKKIVGCRSIEEISKYVLNKLK